MFENDGANGITQMNKMMGRLRPFPAMLRRSPFERKVRDCAGFSIPLRTRCNYSLRRNDARRTSLAANRRAVGGTCVRRNGGRTLSASRLDLPCRASYQQFVEVRGKQRPSRETDGCSSSAHPNVSFRIRASGSDVGINQMSLCACSPTSSLTKNNSALSATQHRS